MGSKEYQHIPPGQDYSKWKKKNPFKGPNKTTRTTRILKPGEKVPFGPGVPSRGNA